MEMQSPLFFSIAVLTTAPLRDRLIKFKEMAQTLSNTGTLGPTLLGMDLSEMREALGPGLPPFRARQLYHALYRGHTRDLQDVTTLPASLRAALSNALALGLPEIVRRYESIDGTRRYLLGLADGRTVEAVLMPEPGRD